MLGTWTDPEEPMELGLEGERDVNETDKCESVMEGPREDRFMVAWGVAIE